MDAFMYVVYDRGEEYGSDSLWRPICAYSRLFHTHEACEKSAKDRIKDLCEILTNNKDEAKELYISGRFEYEIIPQNYVD